MSQTEFVCLKSLQTLRDCLSGKLARLARKPRSAHNRSSEKEENNAHLFEADLRSIFTIMPTIVGYPSCANNDLEHGAQYLLAVLNEMVNKVAIRALEASVSRSTKNEPPDLGSIALQSILSLKMRYPDLYRLLELLEPITGQYNLTVGRGTSSLFVLSDGHAGEVAMESVANMNRLLEYSAPTVCEGEGSQMSPLPSCGIPIKNSRQRDQGVPARYASVAVRAIFKEIQQRSCGTQHEIKLKVSEEWQSGHVQVPLDMFFSCCSLDQINWHPARCGHFRKRMEGVHTDGLCAAIQRAIKQSRTIYLVVGKAGLLDVSDTMPAMACHLASFPTETLEQLFNRKILTPITPRDHLLGTAVHKFSSHQKATLALALAKCLMEFFDDDIELASYSWKPDRIYFLRSSDDHSADHALYISLRPSVLSRKSPSDFGPGNPILLSFARLLLEIENGEKMEMEVHSESRANLPVWAELCDVVDRVGREGSSPYIQAVEGCLYLHLTMRNYQDQTCDLAPSEVLRRVIYERIVKNLEVIVNSQGLKRKRQEFASELPVARTWPLCPPTGDAHAQGENNCPMSRDEFKIAIVCALRLEFDAVAAIVDEFWDKDYGKADGDPNFYINARIGKFNVVLLRLSDIGKVSAASSSSKLQSSYSRLSLVLVVGICGGVPFLKCGEEVLLGDVVISRHIVQYDLGSHYPEQFKTRDTNESRLGRCPKNVRNLLATLETQHARQRLEESVANYLHGIQARAAQKTCGPRYHYPGASQDRLFRADYLHKCYCPSPETSRCRDIYQKSCEDFGCDTKYLVTRKRVELKRKLESEKRIKEAQSPSVFFGTIGSGDTVMKSGKERDRVASEHCLIAFEMEGAGVWDELPCIVVKAVCDYADSHKNKIWQEFAAATAASTMKGLLDRYI